MQKLITSRYVHNLQERTSLLPLKRLQTHIFFSFLRNFQCKWILRPIDSRTIIHVQASTACGHCENCFVVTGALAYFLILMLLFL